MERPKKILYLVTKSVIGGAQKYVLDLASASGDEHEVLVAAGGNGPLFSKLKRAGIRTQHLMYIERDIGLFREWNAFWEIYRMCKSERPDVLHLNSSKAGLLGALAGRASRVPSIIFTVHGWPFHEKRNILWRVLIWLFSYLTTLLSHTVICISAFDRTHAYMPFVKKKIILIPNGIASATHKDRQQARSELFTSEEIKKHVDDVWVCTIAELTDNKNLNYAIDAVCAHNEHADQKIYYSVLGDGELRDALLEHVETKGASTFVKLHGSVPDARTYLHAFDIFFFPSKKEGLPYALLEAGHAELPVIASDIGGIPDIIESEKYGLLIDPFDISSAARALEIYVSEPERRSETARALKARVQERFTTTRMVASTFACYER